MRSKALLSFVAATTVINSVVRGKFQTSFSIAIPPEVFHNSSHTNSSTLQNATVLFPMMNEKLRYPYCGLDGFDFIAKQTLEFRANCTVKRIKVLLRETAELQCQNSTLCDRNRTALSAKCVNQGPDAPVREWRCEADFKLSDIIIQRAHINCERLYSQCVLLKSCVLLYTPMEYTPDWHMFVAWSVGAIVALFAMSLGIFAVRRRATNFAPTPTSTAYVSSQHL